MPGGSNLVATAEDCCQACWMYGGQPGFGGQFGKRALLAYGCCPSACRGTYCGVHAQQKGSFLSDWQEFFFMPVHFCQHDLCALVEN